jgi:hypothetical protein
MAPRKTIRISLLALFLTPLLQEELSTLKGVLLLLVQ